MTPDEVYAMDDDTYGAFQRYMRDEIKARERAAKRKTR
jgi:hypothetical protein